MDPRIELNLRYRPSETREQAQSFALEYDRLYTYTGTQNRVEKMTDGLWHVVQDLV